MALPVSMAGFMTAGQRGRLFAMGSDRANGQIGFAMLTVLFLREHNRLARALAREYPSWDDERLFQTARNIVTLMVCKIVVEEYINHITPYHFRFTLDPDLSTRLACSPWHRQNWASIEFNLAHRWHGLIPSALRVGPGRCCRLVRDPLQLPGLLAEQRTRPHDGGRVPAARRAHRPVQHPRRAAPRRARRHQGGARRAARALQRVPQAPEDASGPQLQPDLRRQPGEPGPARPLPGSVDDVDLYVGAFAEQPGSPSTILGPLLTKIIAIDAFSQALTNPLLAPRVLNEYTFTPLGLRSTVRHTRTLSDIVHRNSPEDSQRRFVSMTRHK